MNSFSAKRAFCGMQASELVADPESPAWERLAAINHADERRWERWGQYEVGERTAIRMAFNKDPEAQKIGEAALRILWNISDDEEVIPKAS